MVSVASRCEVGKKEFSDLGEIVNCMFPLSWEGEYVRYTI